MLPTLAGRLQGRFLLSRLFTKIEITLLRSRPRGGRSDDTWRKP